MTEKLRIAHIADVHVRPLQYLDEMQFTFDRLFESLKKEKIDLVVICGDFFHSKLTVSSEYFQVSYKFFRELIENYYCVIIPGNHDSALTNQGRMDAITPVIDAVSDSASAKGFVKYSKASESFYVPKWNGFKSFVSLHHFSIYDNKEKWPKKEDLDKSRINIALYHGAINNCIVDNGWTSRGNRDDISIFDGFDFAFLGDIHKFQFLNEEKTIAYPGSLRQNNFGEDIDKGYLVWEISDDGSFEVNRVVLDQKRYFFTLYADNVSDLNKIGELPEDCRIRVRTSKVLDLNDEILLKEEICKNYKPQGEVSILPPDDGIEANQSVKIGNLDLVHENIRDIDVQKKLIEEYLKRKNVENEDLEDVFALDKIYHSSVDSDVLRDIIYNPIKLKWDNFFSYGKGNSVNFSNIGNGLIGVFGNTGVGKSSIFDVLFFTLFNSIYKEGANKNGDYVNRKCKRADSSLEISLNGSKFVIERGIKKIFAEGKDEPKIENSVDFYKSPKSDANSLNGETGPDTNKFIRDIFGTKEDAEMLSHCSQFGLMSFIDAKGTKRKEILSKFFDLNVFDFKFDLASKDHKEIKIKLKDCNKIELLKEKADLQLQIEKCEALKLADEKKKKESNEAWNEAVEELISLNSKMVSIPKNISMPVDESKIVKLEKEILQIKDLLVPLKSFEDVALEDVRGWELKKEESDNARRLLPVFETNADLWKRVPGIKECETCPLASNSFASVEKSRELSSTILNNVQEAESLAYYVRYKTLKEKLKASEDALAGLVDVLNKRREFQLQIEENERLNLEIFKIQDKKRFAIDMVEAYNKSIMRLVGNIASYKTKLEMIDEKLKIEEGLAKKDKIYSLYLDAVGKNGISYWIVSKKLNLVTKLTNQILAHAANIRFSIEENEEEKSLKVFLSDEKGKRPIELSSGGEKTLVAIAFRAALWKICLLPKMPILVLDESLVFLDAEKYDSAIKLLKYLLQEYFDKIFIITHNEELKRVVDNSLYIQVNKGMSFLEVK